MKLLLFSDIHGDTAALVRLMATPADIYISAGDLSTFGRGLDQAGPTLQPHGEKVWVLPGNHESAQQNAEFCAKFGLRDFHEQAWELGGHWIAGLGYSNPTPFHTPGEYTESEIQRRLQKFAGLSPLVLVCHAPPLETGLDRIRTGLQGGSSAVAEFLEKHPPEYFFCGHIHEAAGVEVQMGKTKARNLGRKGYLLELPS